MRTLASGHPRAQWAAAVQAARAGSFGEARELARLAVSTGACSESDALDLEARMCAQEGQLLRAEKLWLRALELDAGNMEYERGLRRLRDAARPQGWLGRSWLWGSALLLLLLWVGALTIQVQRVQNASAALLSSVEGRLTDIDRRLDDVHGALDARVTLVSAATEEVLGEVESMREGLAALSRQTEQTAAALESRMRAQTDLTTAEIAAVRMAVDKIMLWLKRSTPPPSDTLR